MSTYQEEIAILNVHKNRASKYMTQKLMKWQGETDKCTIKVKDFNTLNN